MPELPDVEYYKKYFQRHALHKKITDVAASGERSLLKKTSYNQLQKVLIGHQFSQADRRGKYLIASISGTDKKLIIHFGMTGTLHYTARDNPRENEDQYTKFTFRFVNGKELRWINRRNLGKLFLVKNIGDISALGELGPEPSDISQKDFTQLLEHNSSRGIKHLLMDQSVIAGIGNVYSDEILFQAGLKPSRKVASLSDKEKNHLYTKMQYVLREAIKRQADPSRMPRTWLTPHRGQSSDCPRDSGTIRTATINGRTTYYCAKHQT